MPLEKWTTLRTEHIQLLAEELAKQQLPVSNQLEPIADFEELYTFAEANPTPVAFSPQNPVWRLESVAARIVEAVAVAAQEPLLDVGYPELARILLEHAEYLYAYPDSEPRQRLEAGSALALAGSICAALPQSELWRLAGFGRVSAVLAEVAPTSTDSHLTLPIDVAFSLAEARELTILDSAIAAYNTVLGRNFTPQNRYKLPLSDRGFFDVLNLDFPGMETVKSAVLANDRPAAKSAYADFRRQFLEDFVGGISNPDSVLLERSDTYTTAKAYLECLLRLSIHPTPAIRATTEIGIAAHLLPEFRGSAQLHMLALRRYQWIVNAFFHSDGFHKDRSLRSQVDAIADFARFLSVDGTTEPTYCFKEVLEKQVETCIYLSRPDCSFPPLGPLPAPNFDAVELCTITDSDFRREDFPYPDTTSHALPETGCYVMRDTWEPDAQYLFFDAYPQEAANDADTSSRLSLYAHGQELAAGSVCLLDSTPLSVDAPDTQWITTPQFDWLEKWRVLIPRSGNPHAPDIHHKRAVFYLKGEYFILHDLVLGGETETLEQVFRFGREPTLHVSADSGYAWTQEPRRSNLFIGATDTTNLTVASDGATVIYRCNSESPAVLNTLLLPMRPTVKTHPRLSGIPVRTDADVLGTGFTLQSSNATDTFLISDDGLAEMSAADIRFVGEYLFLRRRAADAGVQFVMLNGRFLQVGQNVLADLDVPHEHYVRM